MLLQQECNILYQLENWKSTDVMCHPKSKQEKVKVTNLNFFEILQETLHSTHLLKLLDKMYEYEMDPTGTVGATERMQNGRTDGRMDGWTSREMDGVKPIYPSKIQLCGGYNNQCTVLSQDGRKFSSTGCLLIKHTWFNTFISSLTSYQVSS